MLTLVSNIVIDFNPIDPNTADIDSGYGSIKLDFVKSVQIDASVDSLTDTARIILPRKITYKKNGKEVSDIIARENPLLKRGNRVTISLGYNYNNANGTVINTLFQGYISQVIADSEIEIICEDAMF